MSVKRNEYQPDQSGTSFLLTAPGCEEMLFLSIQNKRSYNELTIPHGPPSKPRQEADKMCTRTWDYSLCLLTVNFNCCSENVHVGRLQKDWPVAKLLNKSKHFGMSSIAATTVQSTDTPYLFSFPKHFQCFGLDISSWSPAVLEGECRNLATDSNASPRYRLSKETTDRYLKAL